MVCIESIETPSVHEGGKIGITHFLDLAARCANQVSVRLGDALILRLHTLKHVPSQELCLDQQLYGVIYRGAAKTKTLTINHLLQLLDGKVAIDAQDTPQDDIPLGSPAHTTSIKVLIELAHKRIAAGSKIINMEVGFHRCDKITTNFVI